MNQQDNTKNVIELMHEVIRRKIELEAKSLIEEVKKKLEEKIPEIIASTVVEITCTKSFEDMTRLIHFTIHK